MVAPIAQDTSTQCLYPTMRGKYPNPRPMPPDRILRDPRPMPAERLKHKCHHHPVPISCQPPGKHLGFPRPCADPVPVDGPPAVVQGDPVAASPICAKPSPILQYEKVAASAADTYIADDPVVDEAV